MHMHFRWLIYIYKYIFGCRVAYNILLRSSCQIFVYLRVFCCHSEMLWNDHHIASATFYNDLHWFSDVLQCFCNVLQKYTLILNCSAMIYTDSENFGRGTTMFCRYFVMPQFRAYFQSYKTFLPCFYTDLQCFCRHFVPPQYGSDILLNEFSQPFFQGVQQLHGRHKISENLIFPFVHSYAQFCTREEYIAGVLQDRFTNGMHIYIKL